MNETQLQKQLIARFPNIKMRMWEPMGKHTSFKIGGPAEIMVFPNSTEELSAILKESKILDCKITILGAGTNVLAPDEGINGIVVCLKDALDFMELLDENRIRVAAGVTMARAAVFACNQHLSGLEFAHGIPGTVGPLIASSLTSRNSSDRDRSSYSSRRSRLSSEAAHFSCWSTR